MALRHTSPTADIAPRCQRRYSGEFKLRIPPELHRALAIQAAEERGGEQTSTLDDVTSAFPETWISGGSADPLTKSQSVPFAARVTAAAP